MKPRSLIFFFIVLFSSITAHAQTSLYEFAYHFDEDSIPYRAFILRNEDGTGFIRVRYTEPRENTPVLVEMQLEEYYDTDKDGKTDTTILVFEGKNPKVLYGNKETGYNPDVFLFKKNDKTGFFDPLIVVSPDSANNKMDKGDVTEMKLLNMEDLTKEFMLQYFFETEDFYVNLFNTTSRSLSAQEKATRLFLLVVANTKDGSIGKTCVIDKDETLSTFKEISEFLEIQFIPKEISGNDYSKKNVEDAIREIKPSSNDIVVFYYSGHGFSDKDDNHLFPHLDLRDKKSQTPGGPYEMKMEDIYNDIKAKGARLNLVLSDCCNTAIGTAPTISTDVASTRASSIGWSKENCRSLFLAPRRYSILMTAASKGQESAGNTNDGGIFTFNFRQSLEKFIGPVYKNITWDQITQTAQSQTITKANHTLCPVEDGKSFRKCNQTPIIKIN